MWMINNDLAVDYGAVSRIGVSWLTNFMRLIDTSE